MTSTRKAIVGVFVLGGFFLFALGLFWIGDRRLLFADNLDLQTQFANLSGLKVGSKVAVSGMDAGEVLAIHVPPGPGQKFTVRFRVLSRLRPLVRTDSVASIQVEGLVGSKMLQIDAGSEQGGEVNTGTTLPSREPIEISQVVQQGVDLVKKVSTAVDDVQGRAVKTIDTITALAEDTQKIVKEVGDDAQEIFANGKKISTDAQVLIAGVRSGKGMVGKLFNDDALYPRLQTAVQNIEQTTSNANKASQSVQKMIADLESRKLGDTVETTAKNVEQASARVKEILAELKPPDTTESGLLGDMRLTLDNAREATSDLAENMEALKHNFFFRGYFNKRGFFDLDSISLDDYKAGVFTKNRTEQRAWEHAAYLFTRDSSGREVLSDTGKQRLGDAVVPYLRVAANTPLIIEGYAGAGSEQEQFMRSRDRAMLVRRFLIERFGLKTTYVGAIPMGAVPSADPAGKPFEGVAIVFFPALQKK